MNHFLLVTVSACLLGLAGCGSSDSPSGSDGGTSGDAGVRDAGGGARDSGPPGDAGPATDAGPRADAGAVTTDGGPGTDSGSGGSDAGPPGDGGPAVDSGAPSSPCGFVTTLEVGCTTDTDCTYGIHQTDCCGNTHAIGINVTEAARFAMLEPACDASYPMCGCPVMPTSTDSGEIVTDTSAIQLACVSRGPRSICLTYITMRPPEGA